LNSPSDVGESLDIGDAREVEIPAIALRLAREGLLRLSRLFDPFRLFPALSNPPCDLLATFGE
jgi:hypothetical protein